MNAADARHAETRREVLGQLLRFSAVGAIGFAIDAAVLVALLRWTALDPYAARMISFSTSAVNTWWMNRAFTFAVHRRTHSAPGELARFLTVAGLAGAVNYAAYAVAISRLGTAPLAAVVAVAIGSLAGLAVNFNGARLLVFVGTGHASRRQRIAVAAIEVVAATALLMVPALANGYPLVFPDTGTYLRQALELYGAPDRPPYYSLLILPLHMRLSLWPVAVGQALAAAVVLRLVFAALSPRGVEGVTYVATVAALAALTSLPWHTGQIIPDAFTALIPLLIFVLAYGAAELRWRAQAALCIVLAGMIALHFSHLPIAALLFAVAALLRLGAAGWRDAVRVLVIGAVAAGLAAAAFLAYGFVLTGRPTLSPNGSVFMAARMIADGTGRAWLDEACPASGNPFCAERARLTGDPNDFLWAPDSPIERVTRAHGEAAMRAAAAQIVAGVIATRPAAQLNAGLVHFVRQITAFATLDTLCPDQCVDGAMVNRTIQRHFAHEHAAFLHSRQIEARWPIEMIRRVHAAVVLAGAAASVVLLVLAIRRRERRLAGLLMLAFAAVIINAAFTGPLSGVYDRYGSRVIWLLPFVAIVGGAIMLRPRASGR